ncbi:putative GNAT family acetyltransferase [Camillea tinctor]|nr:putative GNAT family acetyltransferase [Camillea tinctor]
MHPPPLSLSLSPASPTDAPRIAAIHLSAFSRNAMLHAQFPSAAVRAALARSIELKARADIADAKVTVLVVRAAPESHPESGGEKEKAEERGKKKGEVVAFAKWTHPGDDEEEAPWEWPPGTDVQVLGAWERASEGALGRALGGRGCYRLTFMGTDPAYERRGAATLMVRWGMEQCERERVPAYLESTLEAAPFYAKSGFRAVEKFALDYESGGRTERYEEISFVYEPASLKKS